mmetsp:Transcript_42116/g.101592  ORF Transcript_42116/g.101592 Transcript_42116/m.101592 type:complete len:331 (+) Transcript_42116:294-1286(+)|eukprot:CAMPEP_0113613644 /NCGR_PEP_ID=MMETSP0017_2-20120614/6748_1 /TAXON_ID=2856 /ORGANISM="Cylindrotheca closterium" /LENGTH=330 /DNA_ID=CAMNT_0000522769 /DNA_START=175 /DNA_END=1167 /DNA_ORIENTATION=- /assembly_acc=CAM_ASM_000147
MASEEERAKIMAEYLAETNNGDVEEEEEFQDEEEDDEEFAVAADGKGAASNCPVLQGRLKLNDENRLLYLGTWCMKHDLATASSNANNKTTFKLKSTAPMPDSFSLSKPTTKDNNKETKIVMNGFFHTDHTDQVQPHRKIKEKGVELVLTKDKKEKNTYQVMGTGTNEFGAFALKGTYTPNSKEKTYWLQCEKFYGGLPSNDMSDDEIDSEDEQKDALELNDLQEDAELTVEELQQKYYGGGAAAAASKAPTPPKAKSSSRRKNKDRQERLKKRNGETAQVDTPQEEEEEEQDSKPAAKKLKVSSSPAAAKKPLVVADNDDDDDDDDCGF